jgi:hypothetical protein
VRPKPASSKLSSSSLVVTWRWHRLSPKTACDMHANPAIARPPHGRAWIWDSCDCNSRITQARGICLRKLFCPTRISARLGTRFLRLARTGECGRGIGPGCARWAAADPNRRNARSGSGPTQGLNAARSRLLTLTGPGGIGKTRLAMRLAGDYLANVNVVSGSCGWTPSRMRVSCRLRWRQWSACASNRAALCPTCLRSRWPKRQLLAILDNCEHLLQASAELTEPLLQACPGLQILATSRERLGLTGEVAWPVRSLAVPTQARHGGAVAAPDQVRAILVAAGYQVCAPTAWWTDGSTSSRLHDPDGTNCSDGRVPMVIVYPDLQIAQSRQDRARADGNRPQNGDCHRQALAGPPPRYSVAAG